MSVVLGFVFAVCLFAPLLRINALNEELLLLKEEDKQGLLFIEVLTISYKRRGRIDYEKNLGYEFVSYIFSVSQM